MNVLKKFAVILLKYHVKRIRKQVYFAIPVNIVYDEPVFPFIDSRLAAL